MAGLSEVIITPRLCAHQTEVSFLLICFIFNNNPNCSPKIEGSFSQTYLECFIIFLKIETNWSGTGHRSDEHLAPLRTALASGRASNGKLQHTKSSTIWICHKFGTRAKKTFTWESARFASKAFALHWASPKSAGLFKVRKSVTCVGNGWREKMPFCLKRKTKKFKLMKIHPNDLVGA